MLPLQKDAPCKTNEAQHLVSAKMEDSSDQEEFDAYGQMRRMLQRVQEERIVTKLVNKDSSSTFIAAVLRLQTLLLSDLQLAEQILHSAVSTAGPRDGESENLLKNAHKNRMFLTLNISTLERLQKQTEQIENYQRRIEEFELSWSKNKDIFERFLAEDRAYVRCSDYIRQARSLDRRFCRSDQPKPDLPPNERRMVAFFLAVKAAEDDATWIEDFLDTYPELEDAGPMWTVKKLSYYEREFLRVIDWNVNVRVKSRHAHRPNSKDGKQKV